MPGETLVFVVPAPPTLTNSGTGRSRHWRAIHAEKVAYWHDLDVIATWCRRNGGSLVVASGGLRGTCAMPSPPPTPFAHATLTSSMVLGGAMDDDNAMARHKWLIDWLVANGYLASDRRTCMRWTALPEQRVSRKEAARITLTLKET